MLSSLPKLADKAFILGFFLPTLLFVLAIAALFPGHTWTAPLFNVAAQKTWDDLAYLVLVVWVLSVLLMMGNLIELQVLEGYNWPVSKVARFKEAERARFKAKQDRFNALNARWRRAGRRFPAALRTEWGSLRKALVQQFPSDPELQLPTRLGNAIRAFEVYSREIYGADSIPLWLHLSSVIPKEFQAALDDARSQINCAVNISVLAAIVAPVALIRFLCTVKWGAYQPAGNSFEALMGMFAAASFGYLAAAIAAAIVSRLAYLFAVQLAYGWGDLVKAAFDCYLPALAEKLGYTLPGTAKKRKLFWQAVSQQAIYWDPVLPEKWKPDGKKKPAARRRRKRS